jgi:hypothetical protein
VLVLSLEVARWVLMYAQRAMRCRATSLSDFFVLVVGALSEEDLDVKFLWCSEPCLPFGVEYPVQLVVEALGQFELPTCSMQEFFSPLRCRLKSSSDLPNRNLG